MAVPAPAHTLLEAIAPESLAKASAAVLASLVAVKQKVLGPIKLGMKSEQRDGTDYEFTVVLDITHDSHAAIASKDRTKRFDQPEVISEDTGRRLLAWLNDGKQQADLQTTALQDALSKIPLTETMQELQSVYSAAYRILEQSPDHLEQLNAAKDQRKAILSENAA